MRTFQSRLSRHHKWLPSSRAQPKEKQKAENLAESLNRNWAGSGNLCACVLFVLPPFFCFIASGLIESVTWPSKKCTASMLSCVKPRPCNGPHKAFSPYPTWSRQPVPDGQCHTLHTLPFCHCDVLRLTLRFSRSTWNSESQNGTAGWSTRLAFHRKNWPASMCPRS